MSQNPPVDPPIPSSELNGQGEGGGASLKNTLGAHKGKLAIGVAATLGLMVFYKWREKQLAKDDPEDYARLQRLKAGVTSELNGAAEKMQEDEDSLLPRSVIRRNRKEKGPDAV
jgi:hypothetical protein